MAIILSSDNQVYVINMIIQGGWVGGWLGGWVGGWLDGWVAVLN